MTRPKSFLLFEKDLRVKKSFMMNGRIFVNLNELKICVMVKPIITFMKRLPLWVFLYSNFNALLRMVTAYVKGEYQISQKTLMKVAFAMGYLVFIVDLIPDFLFMFGFIDDLAVLGWMLNSVKDDLQKFEAWEAAQ